MAFPASNRKDRTEAICAPPERLAMLKLPVVGPVV